MGSRREQLEFRRPTAGKLSSLVPCEMHLNINMHPFEHSDVMTK
jgi:hypothetical protein